MSSGVARFVWAAAVTVAAVLYFCGVLNLGWRLGQLVDNEAVAMLSFPASILVALMSWPLLLRAAWRARRGYLRRTATAVTGTVVASSHRKVWRSSAFDLHSVRIEVAFAHPTTGANHRLSKDFAFTQFRARRARELHARSAPGASVPILVHGPTAALDIPQRPACLDIW